MAECKNCGEPLAPNEVAFCKFCIDKMEDCMADQDTEVREAMLATRAVAIAALIEACDTDLRGNLLVETAVALRDRCQFFTSAIIESAGKQYGVKSED